MKFAQRALVASPLLVGCGLFGAVTGSQALALVLALPAAASVLRTPRITISAPAEALLAVSTVLLVGFVSPLLPVEEGLGSRPLPWFFHFLAVTSLAVAGARTHLREPGRGTAGTLGLGLLAFLGCGVVDAGVLFPTLLALYLVLSFAAVRVCDADRSHWDVRQARHAAAFVAVVGIAVGVTAGLASALPILYARANTWAAGLMTNRPISGFRDGPMRLGALQGMLLSNEIVARVEGRRATHLRGAVFDVYRAGRWEPAAGGSSFAIGSGDPLEDDFHRIEFAGDEADRFFLPVGASALHFDPPDARINRLGIARLPVGEKPRSIYYETGALARFAIEGPGERDLLVPPKLEGALEPLVAVWLEGRSEPAARALALRRRLERDYIYSVDFERDPAPRDPVLAFLTDERSGHCEYFASAMTLLARTAGLPARMVTGYRVSERNPLSDYYIVRERDAHAWAEVHLPGRGWVTFDPSPLRIVEGGLPDETPLLSAGFDLAWVTIDRHGRVMLLVALTTWFVFIQLRRLWRARIRGRGGAVSALAGPPGYLDELLVRLGSLVRRRGEGESLECYAVRLREAERSPDLLDRAGGLLQRYAALRYGDEGDAGSLERDVRDWLEEPLPKDGEQAAV